MNYDKSLIIVLVGCFFVQNFLFASYDPTLTGYGTAVAYQGKHVDCFLDTTATTNEGSTASPYGIVTTGTSLLNTSILPNYPTAAFQALPCVARFNRDGTKDTNFGNFFPGTGWYINDPSTSSAYPSFLSGVNVGKLVYLNPAGSLPTYFWLYKGATLQTNFSLYKYIPLTGRLDGAFGNPFTIAIHNDLGSAITATVTSVCSVPVSGTAQTNSQTTSNLYISYYDTSGNSYIAALVYSATTNSFSYDTNFATYGVIKFASGTAGATAIQFNSINYDSSANGGAGALIISGSCTQSGSKVIIARYKNLTTSAILDTAFNTTGYVILAAPTGTTAAIISQFVFSKIVSTGTRYYYCAGWNSTGPVLHVAYFNPSTAAFVTVVGSSPVATVAISGAHGPYKIYDMVQIPDATNTYSVAVAVGASQTSALYSGIIDFQFEAPTWDFAGNAAGIIDQNSSAINQSGGNLYFYSCLFDPSLYAPYPENFPGVFVGGNFGTTGCFINYTYTTTMTPYQGLGSGVGFLDYTNTVYQGGFVCHQVFYSSVNSNSAYYMIVEGLKSGGVVDSGIICFNRLNNSFDYTFGGSGNPFKLVASNVLPLASALDGTGIMYTAGIATTGTSFAVGNLMLTAFNLATKTLVSTFTRNGHSDGGIIPYSTASFGSFGGTSFAQLDLALQKIGTGQTKLIVTGTNNLLSPGFVARFNTVTTTVGDGILDQTFAAPNGYNLFNPISPTSLSACAVDSANNVLVAGSVGVGGGSSTGMLVVARYTSNGVLDVNFGPGQPTQLGYGYFSLLGLSGTGYAIAVNNIAFDPATNIYIVGQYTAPLVSKFTQNAGTSPFISRLISLGVQDATFYNNYGTFLIPLQYVNGAGIFEKCLYDIAPISNLSSSTMYAIGYLNESINQSAATLIRFSLQGLNLSTSQALNSGTVSSVPKNINGNICPNLVVPPIYFVNQISSPQGSSVYVYNSIKTASDVQNVLSLNGILYSLYNNLVSAGATPTLAAQISANFQTIINTLITNFVTAHTGILLPNILFLSQAIATNECLLINNGPLIVSDPNLLQIIYAAETILQNNIKIAAEYCTNTLISPYN